MRSRAHIKSHPLHPILIPFPIAFFIGTLVFDLLREFSGNTDFQTVAYYLNLAAIGTAVLAAIPGIIDYTSTVPPKSSAKKRAATHGMLNATNLLLFCFAFYARQNDLGSSWIILTESIGCILLFIAGWMGGTLVYRNQIGVDIRYAHAGKWKEDFLGHAAKIRVGTSAELKVNQMKLLHIEGRRIVLAKSENGHVAFDDRCTHKGGSLAAGTMICNTVHCPWHGSQFDVRNGEVRAGPANERIGVYAVTEENGELFISL